MRTPLWLGVVLALAVPDAAQAAPLELGDAVHNGGGLIIANAGRWTGDLGSAASASVRRTTMATAGMR